MIAVYLGETNEDKINNMSIPFFDIVLAALGKRVNYDAVVNYAGNAFAKDSWKMIQEANPMIKQKKMSTSFVDVISKPSTVSKVEDLGDISWAMEPPPKGENNNERE